MSVRRFVVLLIAALVAIAGSFWLASQRHLPRDPNFGVSVLPGLAPALDAVTELKVIGAGNKTLVTIKRAEGHYLVGERDGYPADGNRVRTLLIALTELKTRELKTDDPARYAVLGVEDPKAADAKSVEIEVDGLPKPLALIVGHTATSGEGIYVRLPGAARAQEAGPSFAVDRDPKEWLKRAVLDVSADRVREVDVTRSDGPAWRAVRVHPGDTDLNVPDLPKGKTLSSPGAANPVAGALAHLDADDVRAATDAQPPAKMERVVYHTFDGLTVELHGWTEGDARWVRIEAHAEPPTAPPATPAAQKTSTAAAPPGSAAAAPAAAAATTAAPGAGPAPNRAETDAKAITGTAHGWDYRLPSYRYDDLFRARDALLKH